MFRRTGSRGDAVLAARRRLAALAAQYEQSDRDVDPASDDVSKELEPPPSTERAPRPRLAAGGRHVSALGSAKGVGLSSAQLALAALVVAIAIAVAAWWVLRSAPEAEPVQLSTEHVDLPQKTAGSTPTAGVQPGPTPTGGTPAPGDVGAVVVDVAGKVRSPGIVELPAGSRVVDALRAAGGAKPRADMTGLNLARPLVDGEQVVVGLKIPVLPPSSGAATTGMLGTPIDLNAATIEQLDTLPGIGPVTATAILQWRAEHGGFTAVDELLEVSGIGPATLADIEALVRV